MLVLSRKEKERLMIGENIVVTIVGVFGGKVRLGIEAPAEVSIRREELACQALDSGRELLLSRKVG
jgi:carbon storage regulator